jgi:cytochrome oxidase Cu insertion factor (SCO1/SenC/PrrC family)
MCPVKLYPRENLNRTCIFVSMMKFSKKHGAAAFALLLAVAASPMLEGGDDMLATGEPFVSFELPAHDGSTVGSADLAGRPYLLFYYIKADTPG